MKPAIVAVGTYQETRNPRFRFLGTGFAVGEGDIVATNAHVLPDKLDAAQREILVVVASGEGQAEPRAASRAALDRDHDLATLKISGKPLPALRLRERDDVREGETYALTGFPIGSVLGFYPVTHRGMIASITPVATPDARAGQLDEKMIRRLSSGPFDVYQLDATAYPGSSGSPLYDPDSGEVVGIINMVFVKGTKEHVLSQPSGITYAIPVRHLRRLMRPGGP